MASLDKRAVQRLEYGLYAVTSFDGVKDNGFICNTVTQVASNPLSVAVSINKSNYSHDVIKKTGLMNVSALTENTDFSVIEALGFKSGRDGDKTSALEKGRAENGVFYLPSANSYLCLKTEEYLDLGSHGLFVCSVTEAGVLSNERTMTYGFYTENVKKAKAKPKVKGYICKTCGYVYEGEELPPDFICPWCKHDASDFEELK